VKRKSQEKKEGKSPTVKERIRAILWDLRRRVFVILRLASFS